MENIEIQELETLEPIIQSAKVCRIGLSCDDVPYIVPMIFGYKDSWVYLHSSSEGKKMEMLRANNNVCFEVDGDLELVKADTSCFWGMKYRSVIGSGKAFLVEDAKGKREALDIIMDHYSSTESHEYSDEILNEVAVIKIRLETVSGKLHGYEEPA